MGTYVNPGNADFSEIVNSKYIDKTGLIAMINQKIGTRNKLVFVSRPRRFGKSFSAQMLTAYYDISCDSDPLFSNLMIAKEESYKKHLNQYNVINLDISGFVSEARSKRIPLYKVSSMIEEAIRQDLTAIDSEIGASGTLEAALEKYVEKTGNKFVFIIDEWDCLIRESGNDQEARKTYLDLLRKWFKNNNFTPKVVAAAYMTGILPIMKDGSESAVSDFWEYTMLNPGKFQEYIGFTEAEVKALCRDSGRSFDEIKKWYDGYTFDVVGSIYNPYSVMHAIEEGKYRSYWRNTSAADALEDYIRGDFDGLFNTILDLLGGYSVSVDVSGFRNDIQSVANKDDVLTLLIHLGYLSYDEDSGTARIPNEEVRLEFSGTIREIHNRASLERLKESDQLIRNTIAENADAVAGELEKIHAEVFDAKQYNSEQALRCAIHVAYYAYRDYFVKFEELPAGDGYADIVYLPKRHLQIPALVVELKWNKSAEGAISQIKDKKYFSALEGYGGEVLLVGINYDKDKRENSRHHSCVIERINL